ncbi:MAG: hypothetical protein SNF68_08685 [Rikenellaceae bacterium]
MIFNISITFDTEAIPLAERNRLTECSEGGELYYNNRKIANFEGVEISVRGSKMQAKCSLHKFYYKTLYGTLDNSQQFTMENARTAIDLLFERLGVDQERAKVTLFEIGLNIPTECDPLEYITLIESVGQKGGKEFFIDANYKRDRQKTTIKTKTIKKVFKIYDKGFEMVDRKRTEPTGENILRIETIYRRQSRSLKDLFDPENLHRLARGFYRDWAQVTFARTIIGDKGTRQSQIAMAENILTLGRDGYLAQLKEDHANNRISYKSVKVARQFIKNWDTNKHKYRAEPSIYENEYRNRLLTLFNTSTI